MIGLALLLAAQAAVPAADAELERAAAVGRAIFDYDRAAWVATDALLARVAKAELSGAGGYVVEPLADGSLAVTFYRGAAETAQVIFVAEVRAGAVGTSRLVEKAVPLTPAQLQLARARDVAMRAAERERYATCTPAPFNTVVLAPAVPAAPSNVYLLSAQVEANAWPVGGHYRVAVAADGTVTGSRRYSKGCLTMQAPPKSAQDPVFVVTHLLDPRPTEIHVFTSLTARLPLLVATPDERLWHVAEGRIAAAGRLPKSRR